jgi:uncharacterized membrane protein YkvA (DUF1232 family)
MAHMDRRASRIEKSKFAEHYSEEGFWTKVKKYGAAIGREGLRNAMMMFYALKDHDAELPGWAKAIVVGALGYLIFPADAIPDVIPAVGYTDDIGVIAAALAAIRAYVPESAKQKADETLKEWFGD